MCSALRSRSPACSWPACSWPACSWENGAEIGQQRDRGSDLADPKGISFPWIFQRFTLGPDPHGHARPLGACREVAVDPACRFRAAGHAGEEQGSGQAPAQELDRHVDLVEAGLGQGLVLETVLVEEAVAELHARVERQADVLGLAVSLFEPFHRRSRSRTGGFQGGQGRGIAGLRLGAAQRLRSHR